MADSRARIRRSPAYPTISLPSTALLLAALLPRNTLAQETLTNTFLTSTIASSAVASSAFPTTLSPTSTQDPTDTGRAATTTSVPTPTDTPSTQPSSRNHIFNNYWSFIIVVIVLLILSGSLYTLRKRKLRMLSAHRYRARALSENHDVGGVRSPRYGLGWGWPQDGDRTTPPPGFTRAGRRGRRGQQVEGLNERGEAPPPYSGVGSKPPSLRSEDGISGRCPSRAESARTVNRRRSEDVEMGDMTRPTYEPYVPPRNSWTPRPPPGHPPGYEGPGSTSGSAGPSTNSEMTTVSRPEPAVTRP